MKKNLKLKEPVKIRYKTLTSGCRSLYLDCYQNGRRWYKFLKLYLLPEHTPAERIRNRETMKLAVAIKGREIAALQQTAHGFTVHKANTVFLYAHLRRIIGQESTGASKRKLLNALLHHLTNYHPKDVLLEHVDKLFLTGFLNYMKKAAQKHCRQHKMLHANTQCCYYKLLRYVLNDAMNNDLLPNNPCQKIPIEEKPKKIPSERAYLSMVELNKLADTPVDNKLLRQAFLFCCFCGLRYCDMSALTWSCIVHQTDGSVWLRFVQQKTHVQTTIPLSKEAIKQLPEREKYKDKERVFEGLTSQGQCNVLLARWVKKAGISKHITFHCARHTYATLLITFGADIYTVSKLLGHSRLQTTLIYSKIVDETKRKTVALLPELHTDNLL